MLRSALRFAAGAIAGGLLWYYAAAAYYVAVAAAAEPLLNIDSRLRHAEIRVVGSRADARGDEHEPSLPRVIIPIDQLTYNTVLFIALFATNRDAFRRRALRRFAVALLILFATHAIATVVSIEATYASRLPQWSDAHYSDLAQDFWTAAEYAYRLAGMFAIAFGCWWMTLSVPSADRTDRA